MPAAAMAGITGAPPSRLPALAFAPCPATEPVRRVISILQGSIAHLEKQAKAKAKATVKDQVDPKYAHLKTEDFSALIEFAWDLTKQVTGIAVYSENEAKKQARKDGATRKSQDLQLIHDVLLVLACMEEINLNRTSFLSATNGTAPVNAEDVEAIDKLRPRLARKPVSDEEAPPFRERTMDTAKHLLAIIEGEEREVFGTTYANLKSAVKNVGDSGYFDRPRESVVEEAAEEPEPLPEEETTESAEPTPLPLAAPAAPANPPPPAPQAVPAPAFSILPPRAPPVTLQQVEHAYFAQQYGPPQQPRPQPQPQPQPQPVPEVFGPQSFIFIQDSELESADISRQPTPRPATPASIPSQTFTNQNFSVPQHFTPEIPPNPHLPPGDPTPPVLYPAGVNDAPGAIANFPAPNPPPIPIAAAHPPIPPHIPIPPPVQVVAHPHAAQQKLPSPSFQQPVPFKPLPILQTEPMVMTRATSDAGPEEALSSAAVELEPINGDLEWNESPPTEMRSERLEIDEWIPEPSESSSRTNGQTSEKFRPRSRGRGNGPGGYRGRGGYQNGRSGSFYRNNENPSSNATNGGGNYDNYRENKGEGGRFERFEGNFRGRGSNNRGPRQNGGGARGGGARNAPSRGTAGARSQYARKTANTANGHFIETRNGIDSDNKQTFAH